MERQRKILVVDDDEFTLQSMARTLGNDRYRVVTAASGSEAIDLMKQESFDLVLADLKMPGIDGLEVLRQAREIAPQAVVLILTGYASLESAIEALQEGAYDYLVKPCPDDELKLKIEKGLERVRLVEERQRAEEALRESEERYRVIFEQAADSIVLIDAETGALVEFNDRAHENIGYTREEFKKLRIPDFEVIESAEEVAKHVEKIIKEGADTFETKHRTKGGEMRDIQVNSRAISIRGRDFIQSIWHDITERKRAEETLRRAEAETRRHLKEQIALREAGAIITSTLDLAGVLAHIAEQMGRAIDATSAYISQHDPETKMLTVVAEYIGPEACAQEQVSDLGVSYHYMEDDIEFLKAMETGRHYISQLDDVDLPESERAHMQEYGTQTIIYIPLRVKERLVGFAELWEGRQRREFTPEEIALCQGISQQAAIAVENARLFEETEERRLYLEGLLGAAPDAIVTLDARHRIVEWNSGAERLYGYSREEVIGRDIDPLVTNPETIQQAGEFRQIVMSGKGLPPVETVRYRKDGSPVDVLLAASPILGGDELIGIVTVYTDITTQKRAKEMLRRRAEELAALQATVLDITTPHDLPTLLQTIVERAALLLNAPGGGLYLCHPGRGEVRCVVSYNTPRDYTGTVLKYGEGAAGIVAQAGEPLIIDDYRAWSGRAAAYEEEQPFTAVLSAPMIWQGQVTGVIDVLHDVESRRFTEADLELLTLFANHAAIAVENSRLYEQAQEEITERKRAEEELQDSLEKLRKALEGTIQAIALTVERRDPYTAGHQRRVADLARAIATEMGLSKEQVDGTRMAGVIHDIGKVSVPSEILSKPGQLGDIEFDLIKTHPQVGYDILKTVDFPWPVAEIVLQHHERVDGSGYPQGLPGGEIMLEAMILAVADVVAAMASHRPYRPSHGLDKALEEISQNKGILYDPEVVDTCLKLFTEKRFKFE